MLNSKSLAVDWMISSCIYFPEEALWDFSTHVSSAAQFQMHKSCYCFATCILKAGFPRLTEIAFIQRMWTSKTLSLFQALIKRTVKSLFCVSYWVDISNKYLFADVKWSIARLWESKKHVIVLWPAFWKQVFPLTEIAFVWIFVTTILKSKTYFPSFRGFVKSQWSYFSFSHIFQKIVFLQMSSGHLVTCDKAFWSILMTSWPANQYGCAASQGGLPRGKLPTFSCWLFLANLHSPLPVTRETSQRKVAQFFR